VRRASQHSVGLVALLGTASRSVHGLGRPQQLPLARSALLHGGLLWSLSRTTGSKDFIPACAPNCSAAASLRCSSCAAIKASRAPTRLLEAQCSSTGPSAASRACLSA